MLAFVVASVVANIKIHQKRENLTSEIEYLKNKIRNVQDKNNDLKEGIAQMEDEEYVEKVAREELGLQQEGEKVVAFVMPQNQIPQESEPKKTMWQMWLGWILGWFK